MRNVLSTLVAVISLVGCGGDDGGSPGTVDGSIDSPLTVDAAIDSPPALTFALTSPTITEGGAIPLTHACTQRGGTNLSPQLVFAAPPAGTASYAVILTDLSNGLVHSAIYDIPTTATGLPADVDKVYAPTDVPGAHQTASYQSSVRGYNGPCPSTPHMYQFKLYAVTAATLPGATMGTSKDQAVTILGANNAGTATLTATFTP